MNKYEALKIIFKEFARNQMESLEKLDPENHESVKKAWEAYGIAKATFERIESGKIDLICDLKSMQLGVSK